MSTERLAAVLDGARMIKYCTDGLVLAWFGSHGLHVYDLSGNEIDYLSVGDFSRPCATYEEALVAAGMYCVGLTE